MAGEWKNTTLGEFLTLQRGHDLTETQRRPGSVPVMGSAGQNGFHDTARANGPGIVVGRSGASFGQVHFSRHDFWPHNTALYVTDFRGNDPIFAFYFLKSINFERYNSGSAQPSLNRNFIYPIPIRVPPLPTQRAIASVLGTLDDLIELNRETNEILEEMARALFESWFVDFDPVRRNKDEGGRMKDENADSSSFIPHPSSFDHLFPDHFEDSELGQIPRGWEVKPLPELVEINPRRTLKSGTVAPYLDMKNLPTRGHCAEQVIDREFKSGTKFQNGDTLLARITPCLENGKTGYVDFLDKGQVGSGSTEYIVLSPKPPLPPQFGYLLARSDALRTHAIQNMTGTSGRQRVPAECFNTFLMVTPTDARIAESFDDLTAPLMTMIKANSDESRELATLRDTLLPKLLSGEVSVPEAEELVAAAT